MLIPWSSFIKSFLALFRREQILCKRLNQRWSPARQEPDTQYLFHLITFCFVLCCFVLRPNLVCLNPIPLIVSPNTRELVARWRACPQARLGTWLREYVQHPGPSEATGKDEHRAPVMGTRPWFGQAEPVVATRIAPAQSEECAFGSS